MQDRFSRRGFTVALAAAGAGLLLPERAYADDLVLRARLTPELRQGRVCLALHLRHHQSEAVVLPADAIALRGRAGDEQFWLRAPLHTRPPLLRTGERRQRHIAIPAGREALYGRFLSAPGAQLPNHGRLRVRARLLPSSREGAEREALARVSASLDLPLFDAPMPDPERRPVLRGGPRRR